MSDIESKILVRELGKLGGIGAKWAARLLPSVPFESIFELPLPFHMAGCILGCIPRQRFGT